MMHLQVVLTPYHKLKWLRGIKIRHRHQTTKTTRQNREWQTIEQLGNQDAKQEDMLQ